MAAMTYVYAAHLSASIAMGLVCSFVIPAFASHETALALASISTGRVTKKEQGKGYATEQIGLALAFCQVLNIDSNKVNGRIFRAKQKLKEILGTEAYERITR